MEERLRARLIMDAAAGTRQHELAERTLSLMLQSPTARRLAESFLREGAGPIRVAFADLGDSNGEFATDHSRPTVFLSRGYLDYDGAERDLAPVLAHELLGHALGQFKADSHGVGKTYRVFYQGDETKAYLIQWVVGYELNGSPGPGQNKWTRLVLEKPSSFHKDYQLHFRVKLLDPREALDPAGAYASRLDLLRRKMAGLRRERQQYREAQEAIRRFVQNEGLPVSIFRHLGRKLRRWLRTIQRERGDLLAHASTLRRHIRRFATGEGRAELATIQDDFRHPFFQQAEREILQLRDRLAALTRQPRLTRRARTRYFRPGDRPVDWHRLQRMIRRNAPPRSRNSSSKT